MKDANWWHFSIDPGERGDKILEAAGGLQEINPELPDGRHTLDYHTYLGLDALLGSQKPASLTPDERCFIVTHQLFEVIFKMMIFDLAVISKTLEKLLGLGDDAAFHALGTTAAARDPFWGPALTASGRLRYSGRVVLPAVTGYLLNVENKDETFSSLEFYRFRDYIAPASGFQTAQLRLIQRALGKGNLLSVKLAPGGEFRRNYEGRSDESPIRLTDPAILREDAAVAAPEVDSPLELAGRLDDTAHRVLARLAIFGAGESEVPAISLIRPTDVEQATDGFRRILVSRRSEQERMGTKPANAAEADERAEQEFRESFAAAVRTENARRESLKSARAGAFHLHYIAPRSHLAQVLNRVKSTDLALHGKQDDSFLSLHYRLARETLQDILEYARETGRPEPMLGTGGGGVPYLGHARKNLIPLFPALIAYLDLEDSPTFSWVE
jgi:tryptophan 2,3-dioxygenase